MRINIKYVRTSSQTQQVIDAVSAAANEYCQSQGIGCNNSVVNKSGGGGGAWRRGGVVRLKIGGAN